MNIFNQLHIGCISFVLSICTGSLSGQHNKIPLPMEACIDEPVIYTGEMNTDKHFYDGKLPYAVGAHHYQAFRANRTDPSEPGIVGWTYNHQPYLAYWNGTFYLQYLSGLIQEHTPPTRTLIMTSVDGMNWSKPYVAFPEYTLPEIHYDGELIEAGTIAVMHQRMGFYAAPNGRFLTSGFYGFCATPRRSPNAGNGIGRVVREIYADGSLGPVYFIRYNRHKGWNETNTAFPHYTSSDDEGFVEACDSLLADKLITLQWWEEDRGTDGFYLIDPSQVPDGDVFSHRITTAAGAGKAFSFYRRSDGVTVGLWKNQYASLSPDNGYTWTPIAKNKTLLTSGAKTWGQRTADGKYVIVHNQSATQRNRFPMAALVGEDGHIFDRLYTLSGEVPPRRYQGSYKNPGLQYFRGIVEGNGVPPGEHLWITYSVNKEDIWITRVPVPITGTVREEVNQDFENVGSIQDLELWNVYRPVWATVSIKRDYRTGNSYLELRDEDPYDYATVMRIFPEASKKIIELKFQGEKLPQGFAGEIEIQDQRGNRALRLRIDKDWLSFDIEKITTDPMKIDAMVWNHVVLDIDCKKQTYTVTLNGKMYPKDVPLNDRTIAHQVERIVIRTGPYRNYVPAVDAEYGIARQAGFYSEDLPGSDKKAPLIIFNIDDVITRGE
jgi:hypothetical protein